MISRKKVPAPVQPDPESTAALLRELVAHLGAAEAGDVGFEVCRQSVFIDGQLVRHESGRGERHSRGRYLSNASGRAPTIAQVERTNRLYNMPP